MKNFSKLFLTLLLISCDNPIDKKTALEYYEKIGIELIKVNSEVQNSTNSILILFNQINQTGSVSQDQINETKMANEILVKLIESTQEKISNIPELESKTDIKRSSLDLLDKLLFVEKNKVPELIKSISSNNEMKQENISKIAEEITEQLKKANEESHLSEERFWQEFGIDARDLESFYKENKVD